MSKRCSWNRDGKALFLISLWICALSSVVTIRHGTPMSFPVPNFANCAFALCPLFPIETDDSNPSPLLASYLQATCVKEQNKEFVDLFSYLSPSVSLLLRCLWAVLCVSCAVGIYCGNGCGLRVELAYMRIHTHMLFSPFPRCVHTHLRHGVIYHHSLHYLVMIFLHCWPIQQWKVS